MTTPLPNWPRLLNAELAASYVGISRTSFLEDVKTRRMPPPLKWGRRSLWDRRLIDRMIDAYSGLNDAASKEAGWEDFGR